MQDSQAISDELFSTFVAQDCDKVEMIFTKFISLISSNPVVQTLLPLTPSGELCNADGTCVDAANDEIFRLTSKDGKFDVTRENKPIETEALDPGLIFEQEPTQVQRGTMHYRDGGRTATWCSDERCRGHLSLLDLSGD
jgi:F-type H+-transporting ATPase subunit gamma